MINLLKTVIFYNSATNCQTHGKSLAYPYHYSAIPLQVSSCIICVDQDPFVNHKSTIDRPQIASMIFLRSLKHLQQNIKSTITYGGVPKMGVTPQIIHLRLGCSLKNSSDFQGTPRTKLETSGQIDQILDPNPSRSSIPSSALRRVQQRAAGEVAAARRPQIHQTTRGLVLLRRMMP